MFQLQGPLTQPVDDVQLPPVASPLIAARAANYQLVAKHHLIGHRRRLAFDFTHQDFNSQGSHFKFFLAHGG